LPQIPEEAEKSSMAGHLHPKQDNVSGNNRVPVVDLVGAPMIALAHAIPAVAKRTGRDVIVVGGLAVVCRLSLLFNLGRGGLAF
jgi:hypothetical protein